MCRYNWNGTSESTNRLLNHVWRCYRIQHLACFRYETLIKKTSMGPHSLLGNAALLMRRVLNVSYSFVTTTHRTNIPSAPMIYLGYDFPILLVLKSNMIKLINLHFLTYDNVHCTTIFYAVV